MKALKKIIMNLPTYFKVLIIVACLINLSGVYGLIEKKTIDEHLNNMFTSFGKVSGDVQVVDGQLIANKQLIKEEDFELGIFDEPTTKDYIYLNQDELIFAMNNRKTEIKYDKYMTNESFQRSIVDMATNLSLTAFLLSTLQRLFLVSLIILAIVIATLILSKFKLKMKQIVTSLFISVPLGALAGMFSSLLVTNYTQIIIFVIVTGVIYAKSIHRTFDNSMTSYYLGEGVYE